MAHPFGISLSLYQDAIARAPIDTRSSRVTTLVVAIAMLSIADLILTINYMSTIGLIESNPLVRALVAHTGSPAHLAVFKVLTVACFSACVLAVRRHTIAEWCAWGGFVVLFLLSIQWMLYTDLMIEQSDAIAAMAFDSNPHDWYVRFP